MSKDSSSFDDAENLHGMATSAVVRAIVLMGVCGCGKTEVGQQLAGLLNEQYLDADDFHSAKNIAKMGSGLPLEDADRWPWLETLREDVIAPAVNADSSGVAVVLGCSALRRVYREALVRGLDRERVLFVHLCGSEDLITARMKARKGHYMKEGMIASQFETLEKPEADENAIEVSIVPSPRAIAQEIESVLGS